MNTYKAKTATSKVRRRNWVHPDHAPGQWQGKWITRLVQAIALAFTMASLSWGTALGAEPGAFPDKSDYFYLRGGKARHKSAMVYNVLALQNSRALNAALLGQSSLMVPFSEPEADQFVLNSAEAGYSFGSNSGLHRGTLNVRYMHSGVRDQNTATAALTRSADSVSSVDTVQYQYDIYNDNRLRKYGLSYVSEFNIFAGAGSDYIEGLGLRIGINMERDTWQSAGYRVASAVNYTTTSGTSSVNEIQARLVRLNEIDSRQNHYELISGIIYRVPLTQRLHLDLGVDYYQGYGRGSADYTSLQLSDNDLLNTAVVLTGTSINDAQTIVNLANNLAQPLERKVSYDSGVVGNVWQLGLTLHVSPFISLRTYARDELLQYRIRKTETSGLDDELAPILLAALIAQSSGTAINLDRAALNVLMNSAPDLGPRPRYGDRLQEIGFEIQIKF
ncbi:MAG: hypothetical protein KDK39_00440 [Leptospiraceae bacterium]|nr:hypothetical protein [Leptospiraceae bacterium]